MAGPWRGRSSRAAGPMPQTSVLLDGLQVEFWPRVFGTIFCAGGDDDGSLTSVRRLAPPSLA